ncbi:MAG: hypothetical protein JSV85_06020 [Candidatus Bathyarchaeota archaeon]|nr:MAG: hypothetical protein JSV85_06020 [Candidatus Bathyarchaeota archaeon]
MSKSSRAERAAVFKDHRVQLLLSKFVSGEIHELDPIYNSENGYEYPIVKAIVGSSTNASEFLRQLFEVGILKRELYDKIVYCPHCDATNVSVHYCCPYCKSFDIKKGALVEHVPCGYIGIEENFQTEGKLICPKCHKDLVKPDVDYRKAGVWCTCNQCDKSFDIPVASHFCRECHQNFTFEESIYRTAYSYNLNQDVLQETGLGLFLIAPVQEFLQSHGFEVESPGFLMGKSGTNHMFDIKAFQGDESQDVTVIDLAAKGEGVVSEQPVIAMFAKIFDVNPHRACLIAVPKMCQGGKKLAVLYKIRLIEAKDQKSVMKALKTLIN